LVTALTTAIAVAAAVLALTCAVIFFAGRERPRSLDLFVYAVEGALVLRAMIGLGQIVSGDEARSVTHIGYLVASVAVLPLVLSSLEGDRSKWSSAIVGVAALVILVVLVRLEVTTGD
jgi:hypothetical protein